MELDSIVSVSKTNQIMLVMAENQSDDIGCVSVSNQMMLVVPVIPIRKCWLHQKDQSDDVYCVRMPNEIARYR